MGIGRNRNRHPRATQSCHGKALPATLLLPPPPSPSLTATPSPPTPRPRGPRCWRCGSPTGTHSTNKGTFGQTNSGQTYRTNFRTNTQTRFATLSQHSWKQILGSLGTGRNRHPRATQCCAQLLERPRPSLRSFFSHAIFHALLAFNATRLSTIPVCAK